MSRTQGDREAPARPGDAGTDHIATAVTNDNGRAFSGHPSERSALSGNRQVRRIVRRNSINGHGHRRARRGVSGGVGGGNDNGMRVIAQRRTVRQGQCPVAVGIHRGLLRCATVDRYGDCAADLGFPADGRRAVIGVQRTVYQSAAGDAVNLRRGWRNGIHGDGVNRAGAADVTRRIDGGGGQFQRAV
ncbi:hypothetical protein D3C72_349400 [compost metagenome]